jgi:hypothetical protein
MRRIPRPGRSRIEAGIVAEAPRAAVIGRRLT